MHLPNDYARCKGKGHDSPGGEIVHPECKDCRRREPVSDDCIRYPLIAPQDWPCDNRIGPEVA